MAKNWEFPRWRRFAMQGVMCVILAATIGLAAIEEHHLRSAQANLLGGSIVDGPVTFKLPAGWKVSTRGDSTTGTIHTATEPGGQSARSVSVRRQRIDRMMSPLRYLQLIGHRGGKLIETMTIDQWPAEEWHMASPDLTGDFQMDTQSFEMCFILPTREAITITLEKPGPLDQADHRLILLVADNLYIAGLGEPKGGSLEFPGGVRVNLPADYLAMPEPDPLRTDRQIFVDLPSGARVTAQLIPVMVPVDAPVESMQTALAAREMDNSLVSRQWLGGDVTKESEWRWRIEPQEIPNRIEGRRAYLMGKPGSRGLLISMESDPNDDDAMDAAWTAIANGVKVSAQDDLTQPLVEGGALARTPDQSAPPGKSWFLFSRKGRAEGWVYNYANGAGQSTSRQTARQSWDGSPSKVIETWNLDDSGNKTADMELQYCDADPLAKLAVKCASLTTLTDAITTQIVALPPVPEVTMPKLQQFVLSSRLPRLLASTLRGPAVLFTDRFIGWEGDLLPQPVLLMITKADNYVQVEINGSGELSRWYFKPDGSLIRAEFPGGLSLEPATRAKIIDQMPDRRLTPPS